MGILSWRAQTKIKRCLGGSCSGWDAAGVTDGSLPLVDGHGDLLLKSNLGLKLLRLLLLGNHSLHELELKELRLHGIHRVELHARHASHRSELSLLQKELLLLLLLLMGLVLLLLEPRSAPVDCGGHGDAILIRILVIKSVLVDCLVMEATGKARGLEGASDRSRLWDWTGANTARAQTGQ